MELNLDEYIRKIPDFPKKGILFYDITNILATPKAFAWCIDTMERLYRDQRIDACGINPFRAALISPTLVRVMVSLKVLIVASIRPFMRSARAARTGEGARGREQGV
jgi:hypothetical protein